jgi:hypothetical protein
MAMWFPFLMLNWETHGKFLHDAIKSERDIRVKPGTLIHKQLRHFVEENAKYRERVRGKSADQRLHELSIEHYQEMLKNATTDDERRYAENHIWSHQQYLEQATKEFEQRLEAERNAVPN